MSLEIIIPLLITAIVTILGSGGFVSWINTRAQRQLIAAQAAQAEAGASETALGNMQMMLGEYRKQAVENKERTDELEQKITGLEKENLNFRLELRTQDAAIENLNGLYLKMQLGYRLNEIQIRGMGYDPLVPLDKLPSHDVDHLRLMIEGAGNVEDRTIRANRSKRQRDETTVRTEAGPTDTGGDE